MKKIFTLGLGLMLTAAIFAADRKPMVTVTSAKKYQIVIDGRQYFTNGSTINIPTLFNGQHDIKVYKVKPGFFMSSKKLVSTSCFDVKNNDVQINIDRAGQIQITESRFGRDWNGKGSDHDYKHKRDNHNGRF